MPDFWSHQLAAQRSKNEGERKWQSAMDVYYYFGAQGPDFFYYINKLKPFSKHHYSSYGNLIHEEKIQEVATELLTRVQHESIHGEAWRAYLAGYMTHYCIDISCHPLICKWGPTPDAHKRVEMYLDAAILLDYTGKDVRTQKPSYFMPTSVVAQTAGRIIAPLWHQVIASEFEHDLSKVDLARAALDMREVQKWVLSGRIEHLPLRRFLSKRFHYDLDQLVYPNILTLDMDLKYDYAAFRMAFESGIKRSSEALQSLFQVYESKLSIREFVAEYFKTNYLGEV